MQGQIKWQSKEGERRWRRREEQRRGDGMRGEGGRDEWNSERIICFVYRERTEDISIYVFVVIYLLFSHFPFCHVCLLRFHGDLVRGTVRGVAMGSPLWVWASPF